MMTYPLVSVLPGVGPAEGQMMASWALNALKLFQGGDVIVHFQSSNRYKCVDEASGKQNKECDG